MEQFEKRNITIGNKNAKKNTAIAAKSNATTGQKKGQNNLFIWNLTPLLF
jgi:hypothetical protein